MLGTLAGAIGGATWLSALVDHGIVPRAVTFHFNPVAFPLVLAVEVITSVIGALVAAIRPSRTRPAVALSDIATAGRRLSVPRLMLGVALLLGAVILSVEVSRHSPDKAPDTAFFVLLAMCLGIGLLGPVILVVDVVVVVAVRATGDRKVAHR